MSAQNRSFGHGVRVDVVARRQGRSAATAAQGRSDARDGKGRKEGREED